MSSGVFRGGVGMGPPPKLREGKNLHWSNSTMQLQSTCIIGSYTICEPTSSRINYRDIYMPTTQNTFTFTLFKLLNLNYFILIPVSKSGHSLRSTKFPHSYPVYNMHVFCENLCSLGIWTFSLIEFQYRTYPRRKINENFVSARDTA